MWIAAGSWLEFDGYSDHGADTGLLEGIFNTVGLGNAFTKLTDNS